jgi:hypothetical protein
MGKLATAALVSLAGLACTVTASAQEAGGHDADELAKQLSNPVAALISVPLQLNYDTGYDNGGEKWLLNIQPVVPIGISDDWNMISRTILPVIEQHDVVNGDSQSGTGDITQSLFFSPKEPTAGGWIIGVGPAFLLPTASDELLGTEKWSIGPTAVLLKQTKTGWTYGALANHLWSVAGDDDRADVSNTFLQPFLSRSLGKGQTVTVNFEASYDWNAGQATIPVNFMYSKVTKFGGQMASIAGGARAYLDAPDGGPDWGLRFVVTFLYPK